VLTTCPWVSSRELLVDSSLRKTPFTSSRSRVRPLGSKRPSSSTWLVSDCVFSLASDKAHSILCPGHGEKYGHLYEGLDLVSDVKERLVIRKAEDGKWALGDLAF
jgi:hypothetical protein